MYYYPLLAKPLPQLGPILHTHSAVISDLMRTAHRRPSTNQGSWLGGWRNPLCLASSMSEVVTLAKQLMNAGTGQAPPPTKPGAVREACPDLLLLPPKMTAAGDGGQLFWGQGYPKCCHKLCH